MKKEERMKKLLLYTSALPSSIPGLTEAVMDNKKKLPGLNYIGSITQLKDGKLSYEGITPEIKEKIKDLVEKIIVAGGPTIRWGRTITKEDGEIAKQTLVSPCKPDNPKFLQALHDGFIRGTYSLYGEDMYAELKEFKESK